MSFLVPLFLIGAAAVAIPVIIHLTNREKRKIVEFPSLMFLRKIPYREVRRRKIRHWLLFALRCLALILLATAFARPFLERPQSASASPLGPREVVLLVDNSYSMDYGDRFERAIEEARSVLAGLGPDDRGSLIAFSDEAETLVQPTEVHEDLGAVLDGIQLSSRTTRYEPGLKLAKRIVDESPHLRKEVYLFSDFQRLGWEGDEDAWLPAGTRLVPVSVVREEPANLSVTSVILEREFVSGRERLTLSARVTNKAPGGSEPAESDVSVEINGRSLQEKEVSVAANDSTTVSFDPLTLPQGPARGTIRLADDALNKDNSFHFVVWPGQSISVLLVDAPGRPASRSLFIRRALALGDRPSFRVERRQSSRVRAEDLSGRDVVVLNDLATLSGDSAELLTEFVREGGGLVVVAGEKTTGSTFQGSGGLLPSTLGAVVDRAGDLGGTLSYLDYSSPIFEVFRAPHSGDFSSVKFFRYRAFRQPPSGGVLARFDDGQPALVEKRLGDGRVLVWTSTLDTFWNELPRRAVYLPFLHQLVRHAGGYAEANAWQTVGDVADLTRYVSLLSGSTEETTEPGDTELLLGTPSGERSVVSPSSGRLLYTIGEQGFYELREIEGGQEGTWSLAANLDFRESDLSTIDPEELVAAVTFRAGAEGEEEAREWTGVDYERRQSFWWYLLVGAGLLLVVETVLSNRLSRAAAR